MAEQAKQNRVKGLKCRLTKAPEVKDVKGGTRKMVKLNMAHELSDGSTLWINGIAFDNMALALTASVKKGTLVKISGNLKESQYQDKDGNTRTNNDVFLDDLEAIVDGKTLTFDQFSKPEVSPF